MESYNHKAKRLALQALEQGNLVRALALWSAAGLACDVIEPLNFD